MIFKWNEKKTKGTSGIPLMIRNIPNINFQMF